MKKVYFVIFISLLISNLKISAQTVLMDETVEKSYPKSQFGLNRTHFVHPYLRCSFIVGSTQQESVKAKFGSNVFSVGLRYKLRLNNTFSTGLEMDYQAYDVYYSPQSPYSKEQIALQNWRTAWYMRFNFGQRGNHIGKGIDIGGWGALNTYSSFYKSLEVTGQDYKTLDIIQKKLKYIEPFYYGVFARFFWNRYALFVEYRISDILKANFHNQYYNVPAFKIGIELGIHK